ncbi:MAG: peptidase C15 [Cyanobacteria bacterium J06632_3]
MTAGPILLTSFQTWRAHQSSNSSDELIALLKQQNLLPADTIWLRRVPVSFELAPIRVISALHQWRPRLIICCGMAENRPHLSLEQRAKRLNGAGTVQTLETRVDLQNLLGQTALSAISLDAGSYVCNHLYYSVLDALEEGTFDTKAFFAHIPVLKAGNTTLILNDFVKILTQLTSLS